MDYFKWIVSLRICNHRNIFLLELFYKKNKSLKIISHFTKLGVCSIYIFEKVNYNNKERIRTKNKHMSQYNFQYISYLICVFFFAYLDINMFSFLGHTFNMALAFERDKFKIILIQNLFRSLSKLRVIALLRVIHLLTNGFEQSSIWQSELIETNYTSVKQFYCDKLHCIRLVVVQTVVKFVSVKYSLFQMQHECSKQIEYCSNPFVKRYTLSKKK